MMVSEASAKVSMSSGANAQILKLNEKDGGGVPIRLKRKVGGKSTF
jgi:hypothetical protein